VEDGRALLAQLAEAPGRSAILLDVDGTLAPIVARPELSEVPEDTRAALRRLVGRYGLVACISGRPGAEAATLVGVEGIRYVGVHGLELAPEAEAWREPLREFARLDSPWRSEDKGLSVTFHYREAEDEVAARAKLERIAARAEAAGLRSHWGRKVLEIRPPVEADKGTAVRRLLEERSLSRALYAGDDATDLDAFRSLEDVELGIRVAVASDEGPAELRAEADLVVENPAALLSLLRSL
jgi:trehalose 6-phosphate phosphatase